MTRRPSGRWLAAGLAALAAGLAANTVLGPLVTGVVTYPISESLLNQTLGLEAVSLLVVAPLSVLAAVLVFRGHSLGPVLALPPTGYTAYMFAQYVVGPGYQSYPAVVLFHLGMFVLGWLLLAAAWGRIRADSLPATSRRRERIAAAALFLLAAFTVVRYLGGIGAALTGVELPIPADATADPAMYWAILLLDLGVVVPATVATCVGLLRGAPWARKALYGVVGWYVLVPVSVAAMGVVMLARDDPNAAVGNVVVLSVASLLFTAIALWVYRPLLSRRPVRRTDREAVGSRL